MLTVLSMLIQRLHPSEDCLLPLLNHVSLAPLVSLAQQLLLICGVMPALPPISVWLLQVAL